MKNWLWNKISVSVTYWGAVLLLMYDDGSWGWDDVFYFFVALWAYIKLIYRGDI